MKVAVKKFKSGERYAFLLGEDGVPDFWVTHFVTQKLRMTKAATSIEQYLKDIKHLKRWEEMNDRDLLDEIYNGKVPDEKDVMALKEHCSYHAKALKVKTASNMVEMGKFHLSKTQDKPTISKSQYISRIAHIAEFLHFIGKERVKYKPTAAELFDELDKMKTLLKSGNPKGKSKKVSLDKSGIADDVFEDFVEVAKPDSKYNPFKNPVIKFRNYLIVQVLYETGFRCAELLALRISDIGTDTDNPTLSVVRRHDSKDDPRLKEPTAKTLGRPVSITKELRDLLNTYIKIHRAETKVGKTHPFIFVSHKDKEGHYQSGQPIIQQTINDLFNRIKSVNPERFWGITPHSYRHYFNDQLSDSIDEEKRAVRKEVKRLEQAGLHQAAKQYADENKITKQRELEIRAELNGHSSLKSGEIYLKRTTRKQAQKIRKKMQAKMKHKLEGGNHGG
ncbi:tyrosine-type recombinase/integrase [Pseudoalteromonas sp. Angola-18]|uniref:tyrosine-type recombinase/integrase n=1 Tax=Pseudoalteromonas sp. Angola-18 TaxID=3025338 RepID=UPI00235932DC|nr:site-specific integrase [Pseudoalteromonas sp. Angola-18]MDC9501065.1 site-specific integrase [Pseudoalteromonas sp. Angola-18]